MFEAAQCAPDGSIPIEQLPSELRPALKTFDMDGDGTIDPMELARGAELYAESKNTVKKLTRLAVGLILLLSVTIAAITGLTFVVVELSKETKAGADGTMLVNSDEGALMSTAAQTVNATLDSRMSDETLHSLTHFAVISPNGAHVRLNVLGTMRLPRKCQGEIGSLVIIVTAVGQITLEGTQMTFENEVGSYFAKAGFEVANSGRRLAGLNEIIAVFSSLKAVDYLDHDACTDGAAPVMPVNAAYDYTVFHQCVDPQDETVNRCKFFDESLMADIGGERYAFVNTSAVSLNRDGAVMMRRQMRMVAMAPNQIKTYIKITSADGSVETLRNFQTYDVGPFSGNVTWCSDKQAFFGEGDAHESPKGRVVAYYEGVVDDTPVIGGSTRKFALHFEDSGDLWEYYDDPETQEVVVVMQESRLLGRVYYTFDSVTPLSVDDVDDAYFELPADDCPDPELPWGIPGTYHITNTFPFPHNQTLPLTTIARTEAGDAMIHEMMVAGDLTLNELTDAAAEVGDDATEEELEAALAADPATRRSARALLAAESGVGRFTRMRDAHERFYQRFYAVGDDALEPEVASSVDARDAAPVAEMSALGEARKLHWYSGQIDWSNVDWSSAASSGYTYGTAQWEKHYANLGDYCKGKNPGQTTTGWGLDFTLGKSYKNGVPCYVSAEASKQISAWPKITLTANMDIDVDVNDFRGVSASGSITARVSMDIKMAEIYGEISLSIKAEMKRVGKGTKKDKGIIYHTFKSNGHIDKTAVLLFKNSCDRPSFTVTIGGKVGVDVAGFSAASISIDGSMPIGFHTENCKAYHIEWWKAFYCGKDLYPMAYAWFSVDGAYDISIHSDEFNIYESSKFEIAKLSSSKWYTKNSDCSQCIYSKIGLSSLCKTASYFR